MFLGLDLSTQQLKAVVLAQDSTIVHQFAVHFDNDLPHYATINGAILGPDHGQVTSPVAMWLEALDLLMDRIANAGVNLTAVSAISGAGQQHGSVYWSTKAQVTLASLNRHKSLKEQLFPIAFSVDRCPIWQDSSTTEECMRLEAAVGGAQALADLTGSRAYERFTGNQISKIRRLRPSRYADTAHISLVSSFIHSLFLGKIAPIEVSDASGMNLMNVLTGKWEAALLEICGGPDLRGMLGPEPIPGGTTLGFIHRYWVERWGFNPECIVAPFTGDNPATVVALSGPGDAILSLGTSTTFLLSIPPANTPPKRFTTSHLLSHPTIAHGQIAMLCYKNGSLARENVRDQFAQGDWDMFNEMVEKMSPGNGGFMGLYYPQPEIIPPNVVGEYFFKYSVNQDAGPVPVSIQDIPVNAHPRAILESQLLSIRSRLKAILPENTPPLHRLILTGGSSTNQTVRKLVANIFGMKVYVSGTKEAAAMGGGLLAKYAWCKKMNGDLTTFEGMTEGNIVGLECVATPQAEISQTYEQLVGIYTTCEERYTNMCWAATSVFSRIAFRLIQSRCLIPVQISRFHRRRNFTVEMKRNAEEPADAERSTRVARIDATEPEAGSESFPAAQGTQKKKKNGRAWKGTDKLNKDGSIKAGRRGRRREQAPVEGEEESTESTEPKAHRLPKRQCALLIGFCGTGYSGMQFQPDVSRTIEGTLFNALVDVGAVSTDNADDPVKVNLARAARTDAGVHAARNIVSMKMITAAPDLPDRINELLPPEIRLWGYVRVQNSFNARLACDSRKYTYYFPSYILLPPKHGSGFNRIQQQHGTGSTERTSALDHEFCKGRESSSQEEELARKRAWRVRLEQMEKLREAASKFEGTHNFHNFTVGREFKDPSNQRHMKKIEVADPVVYGETEWISVLFHGQSFMLHQIRKMMTALVISCQTGTPSHVIDELYGPKVVLIPKMPSLGLLLEEPVFDSYNGRMAIINEKLHPSDPAYRPPIDFDLYRDRIEKFKDDFIYKNMREVEDQTGLFDAWIKSVDAYSGRDLSYFNPEGIIPDAAVIQKGVKRENPFREKKKFNTTGFLTRDNEAQAILQEEEEDEEVLDDKEGLAEAGE
ncbi:hypothetical protein APHAL10511_004336 [Amanita phalloides]|nr:hypothetical protein APHAL10511_004336 [Amanita phalloides]